MQISGSLPTNRPGDDELLSVLQPGLAHHFGQPVRVVRLQRRPFEYGSSCAIEEVWVEVQGYGELAVLFKDLGAQSLLGEARFIRPALLYDSRREIDVYDRLLRRFSIGTATCYATLVDPGRERYWLFLEKVDGCELYQVGEFAVWEETARWIAGFHNLAPRTLPIAQDVGLGAWDARRYRMCLERAQACLAEQVKADAFAFEVIRRVEAVYDRVVESLVGAHQTVIHGEYYPSNILVRGGNSAGRICPVDWEMSAVGPGLLDLAALLAGNWSDDERRRLVAAYVGSLDGDAEDDFETVLTCCRLHLAIELLGRPPQWTPPAEHKRDWLAEARKLVECLPW